MKKIERKWWVLFAVLCGQAPSVLALVCFRALQALGAAMIASNSPAILTPSNQCGQALGLQATMTYLGLTLQPIGKNSSILLGQRYSWLGWLLYSSVSTRGTPWAGPLLRS